MNQPPALGRHLHTGAAMSDDPASPWRGSRPCRTCGRPMSDGLAHAAWLDRDTCTGPCCSRTCLEARIRELTPIKEAPMITIRVTGCGSCPFRQLDIETYERHDDPDQMPSPLGEVCRHPGGGRMPIVVLDVLPTTCPLKDENVKVTAGPSCGISPEILRLLPFLTATGVSESEPSTPIQPH
jgi:hypothetical protein